MSQFINVCVPSGPGWECRGPGLHYHQPTRTLRVCCVDVQGGGGELQLIGLGGPCIAGVNMLERFRDSNEGRPVYHLLLCFKCWEEA